MKRKIFLLVGLILTVFVIAVYLNITQPKGLNRTILTQINETITNNPVSTNLATPKMETEAITNTPTQTPGPLGSDGIWKIIFEDNFNRDALNSNNIHNWNTCYWWDKGGCTIASNNELEWYLPENVSISDGTLILQAQKKTIQAPNGITYPYTSGMVTSGWIVPDDNYPATFSFLYGFAEIRARIPKGQGLLPAFWLMPTSQESKPEIDIMEILGDSTDTVRMHFHYLGMDESVVNVGMDYIGTDFSDDWHIFGLDWSPEKIVWYVDGVERFTFSQAAFIPAEPMYLILNLAVGGNWPGSPGESTSFPSNFEIDYVRVSQRVDYFFLQPTADTYIDESTINNNYGKSDTVYSDGEPVKKILLKYDTTNFLNKHLSEAYLRIQTTGNNGSLSVDPHIISIVDYSDWDENQLTFNNFPQVGARPIGTIDSASSANSFYIILLDINQLQSYIGESVTFSIESKGTDGLYLYTKESRRGGVQLILKFLQD